MPHGVETSFSRLLRRILSATSSLDLCVFAFSNMDLCRAVLALHSRRVTIRVLTDKDYTAITGSQIGVLRKAGKRNRSIYFLLLCEVYSMSSCNVTQAVTMTENPYAKKFHRYRPRETYLAPVEILFVKKSHTNQCGIIMDEYHLKYRKDDSGLTQQKVLTPFSLTTSVTLSLSLTGFLSGE